MSLWYIKNMVIVYQDVSKIFFYRCLLKSFISCTYLTTVYDLTILLLLYIILYIRINQIYFCFLQTFIPKPYFTHLKTIYLNNILYIRMYHKYFHFFLVLYSKSYVIYLSKDYDFIILLIRMYQKYLFFSLQALYHVNSNILFLGQ